jgi:hypothetical protein
MHTTDREVPGPFPGSGRRSCRHRLTTLHSEEPEIHYPAVAAALDRLGYTGVVGLEGWASGDPETALDRFRGAFTVSRYTVMPHGRIEIR